VRADERHGMQGMHVMRAMGVRERTMQGRGGRGVPAVHAGLPRGALHGAALQRHGGCGVPAVQVGGLPGDAVPVTAVQPSAESGMLAVQRVREPVLLRTAVRALRRRGVPAMQPMHRDTGGGAQMQCDGGQDVRLQTRGVHQPQRHRRVCVVWVRDLRFTDRGQCVHRVRSGEPGAVERGVVLRAMQRGLLWAQHREQRLYHLRVRVVL
jgi:hypothetical protein